MKGNVCSVKGWVAAVKLVRCSEARVVRILDSNLDFHTSNLPCSNFLFTAVGSRRSSAVRLRSAPESPSRKKTCQTRKGSEKKKRNEKKMKRKRNEKELK